MRRVIPTSAIKKAPAVRDLRIRESLCLSPIVASESYLPLVTVSTAVFVTPPCVAEIVTFVDVEIRFVVIVNVALFVPALTVTFEGTVAADVLLLESVTDVSADGAAVNVTVPCESSPPLTVVGLRPREARLTVEPDVTVNVALLVTPPHDAEIVAV
jgi:hypothetical protein